MLNRKITPPLQEIQHYELPSPVVHTLDNGIKVYEINAGTQEIIKLDIVFFAGRFHEDKKLVARLTSSMLREGSAKMTGAALAEHVDFYGGSLNFPSNLDTMQIQLLCMTKHLKNILPVLTDMLESPSFPAKELEQHIKRNIQSLKVDLEKNDTVAYREMTEMLYGKNHPYGYNSSPAYYAKVTREDLVQHYQKNFVSENCFIVVSGKMDEETILLLNKYLGTIIPAGKADAKHFEIESATEQKRTIAKKESLQSAIRLGKRLFNRHHPDYFPFYVLNTVLGGYFGSRLMQNLREDKGYTYNIYSATDPMLHDGYFMVGAEVRSEMKEAALKEIYLEFGRLRNEPIEAEELDMVKNYLLGTLLTSVDGPFNIAGVNKMILLHGLSQTYYQEFLTAIKNITAAEIQALANKYLQDDSFYEVIVG